MRGERDSQRSRVYAAERQAFPTTPPMSIAECAAFVEAIQRRTWFRRRWGNITITVVATNGDRARVYNRDGYLRLGVWSRQPWVILHELAHSLTVGVAHGPGFVGVYLFLVRQVLGAEAGRALSEALRAQRVRRSNAQVPAPTRGDQTVSAQRDREASARRAPLAIRELAALERLLERAIASDALGEPGRAGRRHAQGVRRAVTGLLTDRRAAAGVQVQPADASGVRIGRRRMRRGW